MLLKYMFASFWAFANLALATKSEKSNPSSTEYYLREVKAGKLYHIARYTASSKIRKNPPMEKESELKSHPIPADLIENIDVFAVRKSGGGKLTIIAAGYLDNSDETLQLLVEKINTYLGFINSQEFKDECGLPTPDNTEITLVCTKEPHPYIFEFIDSLKEQINFYNSSIRIEVRKK